MSRCQIPSLRGWLTYTSSWRISRNSKRLSWCSWCLSRCVWMLWKPDNRRPPSPPCRRCFPWAGYGTTAVSIIGGQQIQGEGEKLQQIEQPMDITTALQGRCGRRTQSLLWQRLGRRTPHRSPSKALRASLCGTA
jgi:hypothetical protein